MCNESGEDVYHFFILSGNFLFMMGNLRWFGHEWMLTNTLKKKQCLGVHLEEGKEDAGHEMLPL